MKTYVIESKGFNHAKTSIAKNKNAMQVIMDKYGIKTQEELDKFLQDE